MKNKQGFPYRYIGVRFVKLSMLFAVALHIPSEVKGVEFTCKDLKRTNFSKKEVEALLATTTSGAALLTALKDKKKPTYYFFDKFLPAQQEKIKINSSSSLNEKKGIAAFVPQGFVGNKEDLIVLDRNHTLLSTATILSHELQHSVDKQSRWYESLNEFANQIYKDSNHPLASVGGDPIGAMTTYVLEYRAFQSDSNFLRQIQAQFPCVREQWTAVKTQFDILDIDPARKVTDRDRLINAYIWPGNYSVIYEVMTSKDPQMLQVVQQVFEQVGVSPGGFREALFRLLSQPKTTAQNIRERF